MSAFICNNTHITALAAYAARHKLKVASLLSVDMSVDMSVDKLGALLHAENVASTNFRYNENDVPDFKIDPNALGDIFTPVEILKAANCLDYQSCEHSGWKQSTAYALVDAIRKHARAWIRTTRPLKDDSDAEGYNSAPWEIHPTHAAQRVAVRAGKEKFTLAMIANISDHKLDALTHDQLKNLVRDMRNEARSA